MAKKGGLFPNFPPRHIVLRGNNRQICFASGENIAAYANWLHEAALKYEVLKHGLNSLKFMEQLWNIELGGMELKIGFLHLGNV